MKRLLVLFLVTLALGTATYYACHRFAHHSETGMLTMPVTKTAELRWLRAEFKLDEAQFNRIAELHEQYQPVCEQLCARVAASNSKVAQLMRTNRSLTPELTAALREATAVNEDCRESLLRHVYAVSREMDAVQGERYLEMVLPRVVSLGAHTAH